MLSLQSNNKNISSLKHFKKIYKAVDYKGCDVPLFEAAFLHLNQIKI